MFRLKFKLVWLSVLYLVFIIACPCIIESMPPRVYAVVTNFAVALVIFSPKEVKAGILLVKYAVEALMEALEEWLWQRL